MNELEFSMMNPTMIIVLILRNPEVSEMSSNIIKVLKRLHEINRYHFRADVVEVQIFSPRIMVHQNSTLVITNLKFFLINLKII